MYCDPRTVITITIRALLLFLIMFGCSSSDSDQGPAEQVLLISIEVTPSSQSIVSGDKLQYTATGTYSDSSTKDLSASVVWSSSDSDVAAITVQGIATAYTKGTTTISASSGSVSGTTLLTVLSPAPPPPDTSAIIIDHTCTRLDSIPSEWIEAAKATLHIAYGHTSHGSQLTTGMTGLVSFKGDLYRYSWGGSNGTLDLRDRPFNGASDLGSPNRTAWASATRAYLDTQPEINVIIWSWCGQVSYATEADINTYLNLMNGLEDDYPDVLFVYMTGHLEGTGLTGNLHLRNEQIRRYCRDNGKVLYDFADIETYDPDGNSYAGRHPTDGCNYDYNNDGVTSESGDPAQPFSGDRNWAVDWQNAHTEGVDWYDCDSAHSPPLNANLKAHAAWWLWARLAGWGGQ